ncbi:MAG: hypothetical protein QXF52_09365 [Thermoproteota archaeon]
MGMGIFKSTGCKNNGALGDVRQRFIESIEYLRKLGFFEEYSNLTSEEIFEKLRDRSILLKNLKEEDWKKESVFEMDRFIATHDFKRIWGRDAELGYLPSSEDEMRFLRELAEISRGVFQPSNMRCKKDMWGERICFTFRGKEHEVMFTYREDFLNIERLLSQLNKVMEATGYKYYLIGSGDQFAFVVVLTPEEAEKLRRERGWRLYEY